MSGQKDSKLKLYNSDNYSLEFDLSCCGSPEATENPDSKTPISKRILFCKASFLFPKTSQVGAHLRQNYRNMKDQKTCEPQENGNMALQNSN